MKVLSGFFIFLIATSSFALANGPHGGGSRGGGGFRGGGNNWGFRSSPPAYRAPSIPPSHSFRPAPNIGHTPPIRQHGVTGSYNGNHTYMRNGASVYHQQFVQRGGGQIIQRSFVQNNIIINRFYSPFYRRGFLHPVIIPSLVLGIGFWGFYWHAPWFATPYPYAWGWLGAPWYGYYSYYFRPYPYYGAPGLWLTDYIIAGILAEEYEEAHERRYEERAEYGSHPASVIDDQVKEQIKTQVDESVQIHEKEKKSVSLDDVLKNNSNALKHIFVVSEALTATAEDSQACELTRGDLIRLDEIPESDALEAQMRVVTAKRGNCEAGAVVHIGTTYLQEFLNDFHVRLENGMEKMNQEFVDKKN